MDNPLAKELEGKFHPFHGKDPLDYFVILVDGMRITTHNGKSLWENKEYPLYTIEWEIETIMFKKYNQRTPDFLRYPAFAGHKKAWIKEHVKIITLREWNKRIKK